MDSSYIILMAIPVFFLLIVLEYFYGLYKGKNTYRMNDAYTSIIIGIISRFPTMLNLGFQGIVFVFFAEKFSINLMANNEVITWAIAFILYDFFYYWMHRCHHEIRILWATHVVHHHGEDFNLATALRQTSTGFLWKWIFFAPMIMIGIPGEVFVSVAGVNLVYQFWVHTKHIGHLGWMEKIFITPMNHRIHHAKNKEYIDANYGGVFIIWDRMFGTYKAEEAEIEPIYGTVTPLRSWNPIWANFQVFYQILQDSIQTKKVSDKIKVWFSKTYWRPEDIRKTSKKYNINDIYNPTITNDMKYFALYQLFMIIILSGMILLSLSAQTKFDTTVFALSITIFATLTSMLLQNRSISYFSIILCSIIFISLMRFMPAFDALNLKIKNAFILYAFVTAFLALCIMMFQYNATKHFKNKKI